MARPPKKRFSRRDINSRTMWGNGESNEARQFEIIRNLRLRQYEQAMDAAQKKWSEKVGAHPKADKYMATEEKSRARAFSIEVQRLRGTIRVNQHQRSRAQRKLALLSSRSSTVLRLENLAHVLSEIGREDSFAGREAATTSELIGPTKKWFQEDPESSPETNAEFFTRSKANQVTDWGNLAKYNSVVYFNPSVFSPNPELFQGRNIYKWGAIKHSKRNPILAIQVMHWDPKVLIQTVKTILKRRPNDAIAVIDIYGNVFFP